MATTQKTKKTTKPARVVLVTWVSPTQKKKIDSAARKNEFPSTAAFVRAAIQKQLQK
jgi:hypothetical protein